MRQIEDDLNIYSEEVRDILSHPPNAIFQWGNTILLGFFLIMIILSWVVKYPDIIQAEIVITTKLPPEKLVAHNSGKIEHLLVTNRQEVVKNQPLIIIENTARYQEVLMLKSFLDSVSFKQDRIYFPVNRTADFNLGDIETAYSLFEKEYLAYQINSNLLPYEIDKRAHSYEEIEQKQRLILLFDQKEISEKELYFKIKELNRYQGLFEKGIISTQEWEAKNLDYLQQERILNTINSQISQLKSSFNELKRNASTTSLNDTKDNLSLYKNLRLAYNQLRKAIADWELNYVIKAGIEGKVSFLQICKENQRVSQGEEVLVIVPTLQNDFIGKLKASALNSGKIEFGQEVNIRLQNYPDREFGIIRGKVQTIALAPDKDNMLLIDVALINGLDTSYHKEISFQQEMIGVADVITDDLRLVERILYRFKDLFKR